MKVLLVIMLAYLIGNFSSAYVLGKIIKNTDIRNCGSGNAGATNALRVFGKKIGILAFVFDVLKGVLAIYIGGKILGYDGKLIAGLFSVIGHNWPIFLNFKGGKGIATSFGILLSLHWPTAMISLVFFIVVLVMKRYVSLSSITAAVVAPIVVILIKRPFDKGFVIVTLILAIIAIFKHKANIKRLLEGKEYKIGEKSK
ncbi:glycerol-3-phosphate 1-O-acyltransferase PlsY [Schnuerera sp. xch1]|uniref:glycerol-3-phosphate 1-O-acyltransferase PlsY n=1 Tax=Schnuerera sp. xch1 TaxID=2874283 RepID=UPI001CBF24A6|nr:glycerol-3-phosphate 1-O-acyltransferase PlsY [Schnuerera sp. xch1]